MKRRFVPEIEQLETRLVPAAVKPLLPSPPPPVTPNAIVSDIAISEGDSGTRNAAFTISLSAKSTREVKVSYATANGTAVAGEDYQPRSGSVTFKPGETSKSVNIPIVGDTMFEPDEQFKLVLTGATNARITKSQGTATIRNDDARPSVSISDVRIQEGNAGTRTAVFTVTLSRPSAETITVSYATANGTARAGEDFVGTSGTLTFKAKETRKDIGVTIKGDQLFETDESFIIALSHVKAATLAKAKATGTIANDDQPPDTTAPTVASWSRPSVQAGSSAVEFTVTYRDDRAIDVRSLDGGDIVVTDPNGFRQNANLVRVDNNTNGAARTATYRITAPGGTWDSRDNGTYTVTLQGKQVRDTSGNLLSARTIGTFHVEIPRPAAALLPATGYVSDYLGLHWDGDPTHQCVWAARQFAERLLGQAPPPVGANNGAERLWRIDTPGFDKVANVGNSLPPSGSLMIWGPTVGGGYGHVAVVLGTVDPVARIVRVIDSNWNQDYRGQIHDVKIDSRIQGWLVRNAF